MLGVVVAPHIAGGVVHGYGGNGGQVWVAVAQIRVAPSDATRLRVPHEGGGVILAPVKKGMGRGGGAKTPKRFGVAQEPGASFIELLKHQNSEIRVEDK